MNPETKAIGIFETSEDAEKAGYSISLSGDEARELLKVPRKQRDAALVKYRGVHISTKSYVPPRRKRDR